jgi:phage gp46-like protein
MNYCYTPLDSPEFFAFQGDCENVKHDLQLSSGGLAENKATSLSAILIQLNTEARSGNEGGWWGDQFQPFPIGNRLWQITGQSTKPGSAAKADEEIRRAMEPLIDQGLFDEIRVRAVTTITGLEAEVDTIRTGKSIFKTLLI